MCTDTQDGYIIQSFPYKFDDARIACAVANIEAELKLNPDDGLSLAFS